jgi:hypothetical protein
MTKATDMVSLLFAVALFHSALALHYKPDVEQQYFSPGDP